MRIIKLISVLALMFAAITLASLIYVTVKVTHHIAKFGLKSVVEEVWNGKSLPSSANTQQ
jgi:hypothetical protein